MGSKQFWRSASKVLTVVAFTVILVNGAWAANTEKVLYHFTGGSDGGDPASQLMFDSSGNAYGTTVVGGSFTFGTVFKLTPHANGKWTEAVLHNFQGGADGKYPYGGVTMDAKGNLYGTTVSGGNGGTCSGDGCGIIYKLTLSGNSWPESVLYSFTGGADGAGPGGGVVFDKKGNLYGTTPDGGDVNGCGCGVIYQLAPTRSGGWKQKVIHTFTGGNDGSTGSLGSLFIDKAGNVYGVAELGGAHAAGTAFKLSLVSGKWKMSILDEFRGTPHAGFPYGGLISDSTGSLYGTTYYGGANGLGSVFKLTKGANGKWTENDLYSFKSGTDGDSPTSTLVFDGHGNLYGTTSAGGDSNGDGTVFKLTPASGGKWNESVVYRFKNNPDGSQPYYGMTLDKAGNLYGTTAIGGVGSGVVFKLTP
jgi:uncharacterized repeat protein (TIGR03803 family)